MCYLANPQGFNEAGRLALYMAVIPTIEQIDPRIKIMEPFIISKPEAPDRDYDRTIRQEIELLEEFNNKATENNFFEIAHSHFMVAMGDGAGIDMDSGVASEIADFYDKGPIYLLKSDFRPGENLGSRGLNIEPWRKVQMSKEKFNLL